MLRVQIRGLGTYLPQRRVASPELESELGLPSGWIPHRTGVLERRRADERETSVDMAGAAACAALDDAGIGPGDVDLIVAASAGPHQSVPCTASLIQSALGCGDGSNACFDVNATCLSFLFGLHVAAQFVAGEAYHRVLVVSSEKTGQLLDREEPESAVLLGDGAAAAVVTASGPEDCGRVWLSRFQTHGSGAGLTVCRGGGSGQHPNDPTTTAKMNRFQMQGPAVYRMATRILGPFLDRFFTELRWDRADFDAVVPHQASGPGVQLLTRFFGFSAEQVVTTYATHGNCVAASLPLALAQAVKEGRIRRGHDVLLAGTGAGLTVGAMAITF
jgi:3-oxoacyl-[acyl-carrier-protein] synthase-3